MNIIDGKAIAKKIKEQVKERALECKKVPHLACIIVEGNKASEVYVASKEKACKECGLDSTIVRLPQDTTQEELHHTIDKLNEDGNISAILLQLPLPSHLDSDKAINTINPNKDVDCLTYQNLGALVSKKWDVAPCTALGIIKILKHENIDIAGKNVVVLGRSLLVGKSVSYLLEQENATVTICHSKTQNLQKHTKEADILIVAIGKSEFIKNEYIKENAVVIDVGINRVEKKLKGDVDFEDVKEKCSYITPVPGGVGPLTVACLMENTLTLHLKKEMNKSYNTKKELTR